jgi:hypothetical protein
MKNVIFLHISLIQKEKNIYKIMLSNIQEAKINIEIEK